MVVQNMDEFEFSFSVRVILGAVLWPATTYPPARISRNCTQRNAPIMPAFWAIKEQHEPITQPSL